MEAHSAWTGYGRPWLDDTESTCLCYMYFPELCPSGQLARACVYIAQSPANRDLEETQPLQARGIRITGKGFDWLDVVKTGSWESQSSRSCCCTLLHAAACSQQVKWGTGASTNHDQAVTARVSCHDASTPGTPCTPVPSRSTCSAGDAKILFDNLYTLYLQCPPPATCKAFTRSLCTPLTL